MTRFACLAVLAASLFGCTPSQEDLTGYLNRNPALKTLQFGFQYNLDRPAGFDSIRDFATAREYAFVGASNRDCQAVAVYALADAEAGLRAPQQVLSSCDGEAYGGDNFALRLDTRGDLLVAGVHLFRIDPTGVRYEADLSQALRTGLVFTENLVLGDDEVALATADTVFILEKQGDDWIEADRLPRAGTELHYDDDVLAIDKVIYHRQIDGGFAEVHRVPFAIQDVRDTRVLVENDYRPRVYTWNGSQYVFGGKEGERGHEAQLTRSGVANTPKAGELTIYDAELQTVAHDKIFANASSGLMRVSIQGDRALTRYEGKLAWLHLVDHDPVEGEVLRESASVRQREEHHASFEVPQGTRSLTVVLSGTGDGDLYVRHGEQPSRTAFDCSPYRFGSDEVCTFTDPTPGAWYAAVHGFEDVSDVLVVATVD